MKTIIDYLEAHLKDIKHYISMDPEATEAIPYTSYVYELEGFISGIKSMEQGHLNKEGREKITIYLKYYLDDIREKGEKGVDGLNFMTSGTPQFESYEDMKNYFSLLNDFINVFQNKEIA